MDGEDRTLLLAMGGLLLVSPRHAQAHDADRSMYELRRRSHTDYLPAFGPAGSRHADADDIIGPLAWCMAKGASFPLACYLALAGASAVARSEGRAPAPEEDILRFVVDYSFLPDERDVLSARATISRGAVR